MSAQPSSLLTAAAIRERCEEILLLAQDDKLKHFRYRPSKLHLAACKVIEEIRENYPELEIPYHSRWRHFEGLPEGLDTIHKSMPDDLMERGRALFDLVIPSVLLDAGAGPDWKWKSGDQTFIRSEGLALASWEAFSQGAFSSDTQNPFCTDARALGRINATKLGKHFQVSDDNPLVGFEGRVAMLNRLGKAISQFPEIFGKNNPRLGNLFDHFVNESRFQKIGAPEILGTLLQTFGSIWTSPSEIDGTPLGDCWQHPQVGGPEGTKGWVPFHKLSQWLCYSLVEPLEWFGLQVYDMNQLTGLPEYRNGGLLIDTGLLELRDPSAAEKKHAVSSEIIVEWRALTVMLLDLIADEVCSLLNLRKHHFPLARILQGGTWSAGRKLAYEKRPDGTPPLRIESDGNTF